MKATIRALNLGLAMIVVGVMAVVWLGFNPSGLSAFAYVERQQAFIRLLNVPMPILGALTIVLSFASAWLWRNDRPATVLFVVAALLLIGAGLITRFCNQPINGVVMTWNASAPPADWERLRDEWWRWHVIRTLLGIVAFVLLFAGHRRGWASNDPVRRTA